MRIGFMFDRGRAPEDLPGFAALLDDLGADDLWVVEDLGWAGSVASAAFALAASSRLRVGIGIAPVPLRNPALLAMELAALARVHPGRLVAGVGHGVPEWMRKVDAAPDHPLALLEETIVAVRGLLAGETVAAEGREVTVDGLALVHPPRVAPPIVTGVVRPRSLELSGRVADGTVIAEGHGPKDLAKARDHIERGRKAGDRPAHELIVFAFLSLADSDDTRQAIEGQAAWLGVPPEDVYTVTAERIPAAIRELNEAGADTVVLRPLGPDPDGQARAAMAALGH